MSSPRIQIPPALVAEGKRLFEETNALRQDIAAVMGISPDTLRRRSIEWGWKQRPRLSAVRATRSAGGTRRDSIMQDPPEIRLPPHDGVRPLCASWPCSRTNWHESKPRSGKQEYRRGVRSTTGSARSSASQRRCAKWN